MAIDNHLQLQQGTRQHRIKKTIRKGKGSSVTGADYIMPVYTLENYNAPHRAGHLVVVYLL
ncbi:MAG TPA: hypothetical protein VEY06_00040 [Flavisolibacter sp.]|nr:hypothetical protein [Flavisolibacter sp.]